MKSIRKFLKSIPLRYTIVFFLLGILYSLTFIIQYYLPLFQKRLIDRAIATKIIFNDIFYYLSGLYLAYFALKFVFDISIWKFVFRLRHYMTNFFFEKIIFLKKSTLLREGTGYYYDCLTNDLNKALGIYSISFFSFVFSIIQSIFIFILIWKWSPIVSYLFIASLFLSILVSILGSKMNKIQWKKMREIAGEFSGFAIDIMANNTIVKHLLTIPKVKRIMRKLNNKFNKILMSDTIISVTTEIILDAISTLSQIIVIIYALYLIINSQMTYGSMIAIISYFQMLFAPIDNFYEILQVIYECDVSIKRINNIVEKSYSTNMDYQEKPIFFEAINKISLENVDFSYDKGKKYENINFEIEKGKIVGLVGISGEGKTSLLKLLLKDNLVKNGKILINNNDLNKIPYLFYFSKLNVLSQEFEIFNNDLIHNLTLDKEITYDKNQILKGCKESILEVIDIINQILKKKFDDKIKIKEIEKIIKKQEKMIDLFTVIDINFEILDNNTIKARDFVNYITSLLLKKEELVNYLTKTLFSMNYVSGQRLDKIISLLEIDGLKNRDLGEKGAFLSGGEKQKIVFARFLLKEDFDYFIIDEPFTSMDTITERKMINILKEELKGKTGIIISHKFNILAEIAENFIVLENGKISEQGSHEELVRNNGLYKKLFTHFKDSVNINKNK